MKLKSIFLLFCCFLFVIGQTVIAHENKKNIIATEVSELIQIAIDLPELQEYFHIEEHPERKLLVIKVPEVISGISFDSITKFGGSVKKYRGDSRHPIFEIKDFSISNDSVFFNALYPVEGIEISYEFKKIGKRWVLFKSIIVEH